MRCAPGLGPLARPVDAAAEGLPVGAEFGRLEVDLNRLLVHVRLDGGVLAVGLAQSLLQAKVFAVADFSAAATMYGHRVRSSGTCPRPQRFTNIRYLWIGPAGGRSTARS